MSATGTPMPSWFTGWIKVHAEAFGWTESDIRTAYMWWPAWARFTPAELAEATQDLLTTVGVPKYADKQREFVVAAVDRVRKRRVEQQRRSEGITHSQPPTDAERAEVQSAIRAWRNSGVTDARSASGVHPPGGAPLPSPTKKT
jgi:hypothetical protein